MMKKYCKKLTRVKNAFLTVLLSASMAVGGIGLAAPSVSQAADTAGEVKWVMSQEGKYMQDKGTLKTTAWDDSNHNDLYIDVDENITYQEMAQNIWGGCFNERGWHKLQMLTEEERNHILDLLFDPNEPEGLHLTMGRMPIGSSDFAMDLYSLNETENDYDMVNFSIERDKEMLIPYIREALKRQPNLKIWASPWSPPSWMKQEGENNTAPHKNLIGGWFHGTEENYRAYALYFRKFIEAYDKEGIEIYMVSPQNEPTMWTLYSSCRWTGECLRDFLKYLGPQMEELGVQIYLGTFTNSDDSLMDPTLNDMEARKYISGINFQWWSYNKARSLFHTGFNQGMMQSETMCGNGNNDWQYAEYQFDVMYMYFSYGISAYNMWNLVLEWDGENPGGYNTATPPWPQNAPITVNETTKKYTINPQYYNIKHYTDAVRANARRIESSGTYNQEYIPNTNADKEQDSVYSAEQREIAFRNADGTISLLVKNGSNSAKTVDINFNGRKVTAELPAHSIHTFTTQGTPLTGNEKDMRQILSQDKIVSIKNAETDKALCINGGGAATLSKVFAWDYSGQANQQWYLQPAKVGTQETVKLINVKSFHLAAVDGGSSNDGAELIIWQDTGEDNQNWVMEESGEYVKFKNVTSGLYLAFSADGKAIQTAASDSMLQQWKVENAYASEGIPTVASVSVTPQDKAMAAGESQQFAAAVAAVNGAPETVDWTIDGNNSYSTSISRNGLLKIAADETASQITVRATSTFDNAKSAKAVVTVGAAVATPMVTSVSVTPKSANVKAGETQQFQAQAAAQGGAPGTVNWSVSGNASSQTKINSAGLLAVAADETAAKLTVKAESAFDKTKYDVATVTVVKAAAAEKPVPGKNTTHKVGTLYYKVTKSAAVNGTVSVTKPEKKTYASVTIPATVDINGYTFKVTAIGKKAFYKNTKLKKVTVGNNVAKIGASAFASNKKLTTVTLGTGITAIDSKAFYQDSKLKTVSIKSKKLKAVKKQAFKGIAGKAKVSVPKNKAKSYKKLLKKAGLPAKAKVK